MEKKTTSRLLHLLRSSPLKTTLLYIAAAALWIISSSYLLPKTTTNPELQGLFEIAKGLLFVAITGGLLYITLRNWTPETNHRNRSAIFELKLRNRIRIIPATFVLVILLPLLALLIYLLNAPALEREGLARLQGLAKVQAIHIESWLNERNSDAEVLYHNHTLSDIVNNLQRTDSKESRTIVNEYLQKIQENYGYEAIVLLDKDANPLLTIGEHTNIPPHTMALVDEARNDGKVKHDYQFILEEGHLHSDCVVPLIPAKPDGTAAYAFIIMRSKLNDILVRTSLTQANNKIPDTVLLLHASPERIVAFDTTTGKPHHTQNLTSSHKDLPALIVLRRGQSTGTIITTDYRNTTVLAAWQFISGTDWFILAKTDRNEILAPLWKALGWGLLIGIFLIAAIIALLHMLWNRQQYYQQLEQLAHEKQTDKLLKHFFDMPFVGMAIWSAKNGKWIRFNDYLCDMLGYNREGMRKLSWDKLSHPDDLEKERRKRQAIVEHTTQSYTLEKRLCRIDGSIIHANVDVHCVCDERGTPEIYVAIVQDITAYRSTIEALRESEERFQSIFNGVHDGIILIDKDTGEFVTANNAFCNMLNYNNEEITRMSIQDIHPKEAFDRVYKEFRLAAEEKIKSTEDIPVLRKDGSIFSADIRGGKISVGNKDYVIGIFRDTSERKAMMQALSDNEQRLRTLINTIPDLIWLKNTDGVYLLCNTTFEKLYGATEQEIVGKTDYDFVDRELADFFREHDMLAMKAGKPKINEEKLVFAADGHEAVLETIKTPVMDNQGKLIGILGIGRDISLRKEFENRIKRLSQFYAALSECNETIIRSNDEKELLQDICRIAVQLTSITASWVGYFRGEDRQLEWVAGYGEGNQEIAEGPNTSTISIVNTHGWLSAISLPLHREGKVVGVLNLYADIENAFDEDVLQLLLEMSVDISFALDNFVLEARRIESEKSLAESEQRFRGLVEQSLAGIYIIQDGKYVYANPRLLEILGYTSENGITGLPVADLIMQNDRDKVTTKIEKLIQGEKSHLSYEARALRQDGSVVEIGVHGALASYRGRSAIIGLVQDVTDKKRAEAQLNDYVEKLQSSLMQTVEVATSLSEMRDPYTAGHERRVAEIAVAIGREMGLPEHDLEGLRVAGYLHDIGKINIPSEILAKPGRLTELEYEIIKGHPESGYNVIKDVDFPWPVAQVALQHHERINGSGYPKGLKGEEILLEARITAVADVVEAMGSHRPYRPGLGIKPALEEIERGSGTLYDPQVAEACLHLFREKGYSLPA